jgi:beta-galactosidase
MMKNESGMTDSLSRRSLLGQAVGAAGLLSALGSTGQADAQAPPAGGGRMRGRVRDSFDFGWKFFKGDVPGAQQPNFADAGWRDVDLPHDWSIEGPYSEEPRVPSGGAQHLPMGIGWYRKHFNIPESYGGNKVFIEFEGVYQLSEVWINGQYLGKRPNGFIGFCYDLTPHLKYGGDNVIAVKADNSHQPNCRWYSGSGIYRHTWLLVTNLVHVAYWGTFVTTPQADMDAATVQIKVRVQNEGKSAVECRLTNTILDRDGNPAEGAQPTESKSIPANGEYEFVQQIRVDQPNLWSIDNPYLYKVRTSVMDPDMVVDAYDTVLGIRRVEFDVDRGFLLNGRHVKLNGFYGHQDGGCVGNAVPARVWERRLEILKEMGCNSIRTGHNPWSPDFMDSCDKLGFMVMNELFDEWKQPKLRYGYGQYFDEWSERDVTSFVRRDRNHPSVLLWSAGNEIGEQAATDGVEMVKRLVDIFHREDPTRPVTMGCDRIAANLTGREVATPPEFLAVLDVVGYNYFDRRRERAEKYCTDDRYAFPKRKFIGTENIGMAGTRGEYPGLFPPVPGVQLWGIDANRGTDVEQLWKFTRLNDWVTGDHTGSGVDYLAETQWPRICPAVGSLDTAGFVKDAYYFYQSQWTDKTVLHIFPHWNWKGKEGEIIPVICYTNCDSVELFLNGKSYGVQGYWFPRVASWPERRGSESRSNAPRTTSDLHLTWPVPYQPGTLKAVGTKAGKVVAEVEVTTTGEPAAIGLSADRDAIAADRRDVAHFTVQILDAQGRVVPGADNEVAFEIQGEGKIIGVDNGNPLSHESFKANRRKAFHGLCLAIVQSTAKAGRIELTATSPGLKSSSVAVTTKA